MIIKIKTLIAIILGIFVFYLYVSNVRPVGWFDSVVGLALGLLTFICVKFFKGIKI
jgi:uncharacterized BrkB/YihY/UPF0761 family membrane protein